MSAIDKEFKRLINAVRAFGVQRPNRTGVDTRAIPSAMFMHDMRDGFPILHNKKMSFQTSRTELIGFLLGITSKKWYQERGCTIWDEWCNPQLIPGGLPEDERKAFMKSQDDLGPVYGAQWRNFNRHLDLTQGCGEEADQVFQLLNTLGANPDSRRMMVSAWNPLAIREQALPPCHFAFQVLVIGGQLHLNWSQRSVDLFLGLPYNILFYGTLLACLAHQFDLEPGTLTGFLGDTHIYENHLEAVDEYMSRPDAEDCNPTLSIPKSDEFTILDEFWMSKLRIKNYKPLPAIKAEIAV